MSIKTRILLACLAMTTVTLLFGATMWHAQTRLGTIGGRLYDEAFQSMAHIRAAQHELLAIAGEPAVDAAARERIEAGLRAAAENAAEAQEEALSAKGRAAGELRQEIEQLSEDMRREGIEPDPAQLRDIEDRFDHAVELNAGDGFRARRAADAVIAQIGRETWVALGVSVVTALLITVALSRVIQRAVGDATEIAARIAGGKLDNRIEPKGPSEIAALLRALSRMQASIAHRMQQITDLMRRRETDFRAEMQTQRQKLEVALENMAQALCMYDEDGGIVLVNTPFTALFGEVAGPERIADKVLPLLAGQAVDFTPADGRLGSQVARLADGRTLSISVRRMESSGRVATFEDISQQVQAQERLEYLAQHDLLTGLANRETFCQQGEAIRAALGPEQMLLVLYVGLDRFKVINETLGHGAGDRLLCIVAERLQHAIRGSDRAARVGGDEFAVGSVVRSLAQGQALAERLRRSLAAPVALGEHHFTLTASVGIATAAGPGRVDAVLAHAELALRRAKANGGDTTSCFEQEMDDQLQERRQLEAELRTAVAQGQFWVAYQPFVCARSRRVLGYEALVRWDHPTRGALKPAEFLGLAEETGLMGEIGWFVLREACRRAAQWRSELRLAVNVSSRQFQDPGFVPLVSRALAESGLEAGRLELEVTEAILLRQSSGALALFGQLREMGVTISMDDFGTGFSSLSYLSKFRFDRLKIDRSFIQNLVDTPESLAIMRAAINLGRAFEMSVVAEGVETEQQLALAVREGCDVAQGFLFSEPAPCDFSI